MEVILNSSIYVYGLKHVTSHISIIQRIMPCTAVQLINTGIIRMLLKPKTTDLTVMALKVYT